MRTLYFTLRTHFKNTNFHSLLPSRNRSALTCLTPGFFLSLIPVCWPLPWPLPSSASALLLLRCSCCGSRGNVTLWGTCGWWVAPGPWLAAAWHVSPPQVASGSCMMTVTLPCIVPFSCINIVLFHFYQREVRRHVRRREVLVKVLVELFPPVLTRSTSDMAAWSLGLLL